MTNTSMTSHMVINQVGTDQSGNYKADDRAGCLNILLLIDSYGAGGAQNQLSLLATQLHARGHSVESFQYFPDDFFAHRLDAAGIERHVNLKKGKLGLGVVIALRALINSEHFDIILAYMDTPNLYAAAALVGCKRPPLLITSHRSRTQFESLGKVVRWLRLWSNRRASAVVCNSHHERKNWEKVLPGADVSTIYNGIEDPLYGQEHGQRQLSSPATQSDSRRTLLAVGSIHADKNALLIVDAMIILRQRGPLPFKLIWVGDAKPVFRADIEHRDALVASLENARLSDDWHFAGKQSAMAAYYRGADALVHASITEGLPNVVCEAQMFGLPVLISDVLDHPRMVEEGVTGFRFDPADAHALATAMEHWLRLSPDECQRMRNTARSQALATYSLPGCAEEYEVLFHRLLKQKEN